MTDAPISPGEVVHVEVFRSPDFSTVTRVSQTGDIAFPVLGILHIAGLSSAETSDLVSKVLKDNHLMLDPHVLVTVDSTSTGITVLGEVRNPGIFTPPGKHQLSDIISLAGGLTVNTGKLIEISNADAPQQKTLVPWDPTMRKTSNYDRPVYPGQTVLVRPCGFIYVGGNVAKPGAYATCFFSLSRLSQVIAQAGGTVPLTSLSRTILIRTKADGSRVIIQLDLDRIFKAKDGDPVVQEGDIVYVPASALKANLKQLTQYAFGLGTTLLYVYH
ncbi:polysaccharide biosynthesis/export family protein [Acidobacterium sp. S8]|uniref:polysaccharide biosynthesis/export family protein n=1 Tax=Acidobacterium sp. S8 TaxID=1641854 RepID=UPI00131EA367|nr:SLBB domain-containing protein [Acidobacterium sp. S8]